MDVLICPACGATNPVEATVCESCSENLTAVKSVMDTANMHYNEALALSHAGKLDEAIGQLEAALALSSQNPNFHNLLGTIYAQKGLFSEAIRAWERCLALDVEVEKAYKNIEKARHMEEDTAEEQRKRPFLLTSIVAGSLAAVLLLSTVYFAAGKFFKSRHINTLTNQMQVKTNEVNDWKARYNELNGKFPSEGLSQILANLAAEQKLSEDREKRIKRLTENHQRILDARTKQIQELQTQIDNFKKENNQQKKELQQINSLQAIIKKNEARIASLTKTMQDKDEEITIQKTRAQEFVDKLKLAQDTTRSVRADRDRALDSLRKQYNNQIDELRSQMRENRDEIARFEQEISDRKYADGLMEESLKNLESNSFDLAFQNVRDALERVNDHGVALYVQQELQRIMNDPLEQEIRRQETQERERQRKKRKLELISQNIKSAQDYFNKGYYDEAKDYAERAISLEPQNEKDIKSCKRLINQSEEQKREIVMIISQAREDISQDKFKKAESALKKILKRSPTNTEAQGLLEQLQK